MTRPEGGRVVKPCAGCGGRKPIYTDGEDFFKWDGHTQLYRTVDYNGQFYSILTHPGFTEAQLIKHFGAVDGMSSQLRVATEFDIIWRSLALLMDVAQKKRSI